MKFVGADVLDGPLPWPLRLLLFRKKRESNCKKTMNNLLFAFAFAMIY